MTQRAVIYAKALYQAKISPEAVKEAVSCLEDVPRLLEVLKSPAVPFSKKERVIDRIFSEEAGRFLKVLCRHQAVGEIREIGRAYHGYRLKMADQTEAVLYYVTEPSEEQLEKIRQFLCRKYGSRGAEIRTVQKKELISGFVLMACGEEYDRSLLGRLKQMRQELTGR